MSFSTEICLSNRDLGTFEIYWMPYEGNLCPKVYYVNDFDGILLKW